MSKKRHRTVLLSDIVIPDEYRKIRPNYQTVAEKADEYERKGRIKPFVKVDENNVLVGEYAAYLALVECGAESAKVKVIDNVLVIEVTIDTDKSPIWIRSLQPFRKPPVPEGVALAVSMHTRSGNILAVTTGRYEERPISRCLGMPASLGKWRGR